MLNTSMMLFLNIMILGTTITLSSETWLGMWMGLEMNLIAFIPILYKQKNKLSSESCMIYFLVQSLGSILMLMSVLNNWSAATFPNVADQLFLTVLSFSMMIKLGLPPFHFWFPEILEKMNWPVSAIMMTWQKIAPLSILSLTASEWPLLPLIISTSVVVGALGGLNQTSIRKIMAYSSISHMGWMIACMKFNNNMWIKYLMMYSVIILMMIYVFNHQSSSFINQMIRPSSPLTEKILIMTLFLSLGGLPPFMGFLPKWTVIQSMIISNSFFILFIMIMSVLISLFYYLRVISTIMMISSTTLKWHETTLMKKYLTTLMIMINLSLPVIATLGL